MCAPFISSEIRLSLTESLTHPLQVVHDKIGVTEASEALDVIMTSKPTYKFWQHLIIGGLASALIQPSAFYGSFIDCLVAIPLGMLLVIVQVLVSKNDLYSSLFESVRISLHATLPALMTDLLFPLCLLVFAESSSLVCTIIKQGFAFLDSLADRRVHFTAPALNSFLAAAIASSNTFCFAAIASGSVVLILPGYIVLVGALGELLVHKRSLSDTDIHSVLQKLETAPSSRDPSEWSTLFSTRFSSGSVLRESEPSKRQAPNLTRVLAFDQQNGLRDLDQNYWTHSFRCHGLPVYISAQGCALVSGNDLALVLLPHRSPRAYHLSLCASLDD